MKKSMSLFLQARIQQTLIVLLVGAILMTLLAPIQSVFADRQQNQDQNLNLPQRAFIYQGQLKAGSAPANGTYDFQFTLYTAQTGGEVLNIILHEDLVLTNGLFKVELDFGGAAFDAEESWLEIAVRAGDSTEPYIVLSPRQKLTPTPYAIFAQAESWNLIGVPVGVVGRREIGDMDDIMTDEKSVNERGVKNRASSKDAKTPATGTSEAAALVGTQNYIAKFDGSGNATVNSIMFDNGTNVGIGTGATTPAAKLHIHNTDATSTTTTDLIVSHAGRALVGGGTAISLRALGSELASITAVGSSTSDGITSGSLRFLTRNAGTMAERMIITSSGNVGIGTTDPRTALHIRGSGSGQAGAIRLDNGAVQTQLVSDATQTFGQIGTLSNHALNIITNNSSKMFITPAGNVGIGTTDPGTAKLAVMNGNVGIGTTNPRLTLDVMGSALFEGNNLYVRNPASPAGRQTWGIVINTSTGQLSLGQAPDIPSPGNLQTSPLIISAGAPSSSLMVGSTGAVGVRVLEITGGSDLAEPFEISEAEAITPGTVVAIDPNQPGRLRLADKAYDRTVAGIVSGANGINPGLTMKQQGTVADGSLPVALTGRVYCWADASNGPIKPGDLLTTSDTPGHAMKVKDHKKAQGAILGKAMSVLKEGRGIVLVLVSLQ